jgi:hypothetical protein
MDDESWIYAYDPEKSNNRRSGRTHNHQEEKSAAGPEFNNEQSHCFST